MLSTHTAAKEKEPIPFPPKRSPTVHHQKSNAANKTNSTKGTNGTTNDTSSHINYVTVIV